MPSVHTSNTTGRQRNQPAPEQLPDSFCFIHHCYATSYNTIQQYNVKSENKTINIAEGISTVKDVADVTWGLRDPKFSADPSFSVSILPRAHCSCTTGRSRKFRCANDGGIPLDGCYYHCRYSFNVFSRACHSTLAWICGSHHHPSGFPLFIASSPILFTVERPLQARGHIADHFARSRPYSETILRATLLSRCHRVVLQAAKSINGYSILLVQIITQEAFIPSLFELTHMHSREVCMEHKRIVVYRRLCYVLQEEFTHHFVVLLRPQVWQRLFKHPTKLHHEFMATSGSFHDFCFLRRISSGTLGKLFPQPRSCQPSKSPN